MKKLILIPIILLCVSAFGQFTKPQLYNGINTNIRNKSASQFRIAAMLDSIVVSMGSGGSGLTIGSSTITSGTNTRVLYNNSGVLGEYAISGSGNVAMTTSPVFTTPNIGTATGSITGNAATVTTNANLTGHITSTGNATLLGSFTIAQLSTAISDANISGTNTGDQTFYAANTLVSNATDADFTATANGVHNILDGVASANRVITIPTGSNGDVMKFYNTEDTRVWSFTGATVYLADRVTVVTELLYNVPCHMERIDGLWIITN